MKMRRPSIAWRLAIGLSAGTGLLWIGSLAISGIVMQHELNESIDESIRQSALRLLPLAIHDLREPHDRGEMRISGLDTEEGNFIYVVTDKRGTVIVAEADARSVELLAKVPDGYSDIKNKRVFAVTDNRSGYGIAVMERSDHSNEVLRRSITAIAGPFAALIPLIAVGIWFAVRLAMRPLEQLSRAIAARDSRDLSALPSIPHPAELVPIADAVTGLLERLRNALDAERTFAASSAHELRTPIAGALAQVQLLANELGDGPGQKRIMEIEASLKSLSQLSEKLLQLSRLDAGFARAETPTDLLPVVDIVVRDFNAATKSSKRVKLQKAGVGDLFGTIHPDAFAIALTNLIQNALIHGKKNGRVEITVTPGKVDVINDGPIVPPDLLARVGERFERGATTAIGAGLGLSIVRTIMEQTGGSVEFNSPVEGRTGGFEAILHLG